MNSAEFDSAQDWSSPENSFADSEEFSATDWPFEARG